jgi:hypothetical protein
MIQNKTWIDTLEIIFIVCILLLSSSPFISSAVNLKKNTTNTYHLTVTKTGLTGVEFRVSIEGYTKETIDVQGKNFQHIELNNAGKTAEYGKPELPVVSFYVAVPQGAEVHCSYTASDIQKLTENQLLYPAQPPLPETEGYIDPSFTLNESFYSSHEYYPASVVEVSPIMVLRGCNIVLVSLFPFAYNPAMKTLQIMNNIQVSLSFQGGTGEFIAEKYRSIYFQPILNAFLLNSNSIEQATVHSPPTQRMRLNESERADLLIVVYDPLYDAILPLAEWRRSTGLEIKIVNWSDIGTTAADLRSYVSNAYDTWELPPSFLLIVGDADQIPVNYLYIDPYSGIYTGTDLWYSAVAGSDYLPELNVGRISVENPDELTTVVNKILSYSTSPYMEENWFNNILLAAYQESGRYFIWCSNTVYDYLTPLGYNCIRQYQGSNPPGSTQGVIDAINSGVIIANHRDHGASQNDGYSYTGWSYPQFSTANILDNIHNGEKYPVMFSLNCESGWFDGETDPYSGNYESIGEIGLRAAGKGFVGVIASTRVSYSGYNDELCRGLFDGMFPGFDPDYPNGGSSNPYDTEVHLLSQVMNYGKFWMYDKYIIPGGCSPYPWNPDPDTSRVEFEEFNVMGDPTMDIWTAYPQTLTVTHPDRVSPGPSTITVTVTSNGTPIPRALIGLTQPDGMYAKGITDDTGTAEIEISPQNTNPITIVVTAHNYLYYSDIIPTNLPPFPPTQPTGQTKGKSGNQYLYQTNTTDLDGDEVFYQWDWGDGNFSDWLGPYASGIMASATHAWNQGSYEIKVKAKDINGGESDWSEPLAISMPMDLLSFLQQMLIIGFKQTVLVPLQNAPE